MSLLDRLLRRELPAQLPPLADGERVVAWGITPEGPPAVATNRALWLPLKPKAVIYDVVADAAETAPPTPVTTSAPAGPAAGSPAERSAADSSAEPSAADGLAAPSAAGSPAERSAADGPSAAGAGAPTAASWQRLGWAEIHKAAWAEETLTVTPGVEVEPGVVADGRIRRLRLTNPRDLPAEVRTRVTRSVAHTSSHRLTGGGSVRVVARRVPGADGLTWQLRFDSAADRTKPGVRAEAEGILTEVRALTTPE